MVSKDFGVLVREEREKRDWSQEKLGQKAGLATNTVFSLEHGKPTTRKSRDKVAFVLEIELE